MEKQKRNRPKLDRRNAVKNIEYDASYSPSSSFAMEGSDTTSFSSSSTTATTRSRSLDIDTAKITSFRVRGIDDGEFDLICQTLGFSGPEDFSIPASVWEAQKARRSSFDNSGLSPQFQAKIFATNPKNSNNRVSVFKREIDDSSKLKSGLGLNSVQLANGARVGNLVGVESVGNGRSDRSVREVEFERGIGQYDTGARVRVFDKSDLVGWDRIGNDACDFTGRECANVTLRSTREGVNGGGGGGGINGERPPVLAPPPGMLMQPVIDNVSSTWDLLKSFAPQDDEEILIQREVSSSDEEDRVTDKNTEVEDNDGNKENELSQSNDYGGDNGASSESDVLGSVMPALYLISPDVKLRRSISSWEKGGLLGSGTFGTVYEGITDDGFFFAVKEVSLLDQGSQGKQSILQLEQEISLLREFEHENIIRYLGTDKDETKLYIFLELATKGSLAKLYETYHLRGSHVSAYTRQILNGLRYLHDRNVVHRDIKCANILVDATGSVKLADFGLAKATRMNDVKSCKGTAFWMAPEVVNLKNRGYGLAADIWSLGCTVLEMLTGRLPYSHLEPMQALFRIGKGEPPPVPDSLSADSRDFILKCLQVNSADRPTAKQLLDHPFVKRPLQTFLSPSSPRFGNLRS